MGFNKEKNDATKKKGMALSDDALERVTGGGEWVIAILDENGNVTGEWGGMDFGSQREAESEMNGIPDGYRPGYMKVMTLADYRSQRWGGADAPVSNGVTHVGPRGRSKRT